ncbi:hypothetical protein KBZ10_11880 [Streptomyces sp. F63]|uniref:DUF4435 domain-containing protein n=1 Tax=Streptomyces sp. F63 TaxID=2824887 RepID=UPI001B3653FE|nr:DUF4435 domain-containing protein [Streptomyces sp. F63]MBQ0985206.1 hypothetical protein [Streptomyces sp. F63]
MAASPSLRELDRLEDRIRLHRQRDKRPVIIVEGPSDARILQRAFQEKDIAYFPASTRSLALEAAEKLEAWAQENFACVVDRDFDDAVEHAEQRLRTVHPYENADMEAMLALSRAGLDLLLEVGSCDKIEKLGGAQKVSSQLMGILEPVTRLRRANAENSWGLAFDAVDLSSKIDKKTMTLKVRSFCNALLDNSRNTPELSTCGWPELPSLSTLMDHAEGRQHVTREPVCPRGSKPYFRGRDFLLVLGVALCGYCGTKRAQSVTQDILEGALRLAGAHELGLSQWGLDLLRLIGAICND